MLSAGMPLKCLQLTLSNDSSTSLRSSPSHPPVLERCTYSGPSGNLLLEGSGTTVKLECEDAARGSSAFLTYLLGNFKKTLIVWLCMDTEGPEIKFAIFDEDPKLDHNALKKVAKGDRTLETFGFGSELLWKFKDNEGRMHDISMVVDIASTDRQLEAQLNIREPNNLAVDVSQPIKALYKVTATMFKTLAFDHVHEDMVISALISAFIDGFPEGTTFEGIHGKGIMVAAPASWEFIRGVLWNDDPGCDLFYSRKENNGLYRPLGGDFLSHMNDPQGRHITYRSHHGDLQFLHAMASKIGEDPQETLGNIMLWLEVMYKLSTGDKISETDQIKSTKLEKFFNDTTTPKGSDTLRELLECRSLNSPLTDVKRRALGSCFHTIQDSYAVGHCRRILNNPGDMQDVEFARHLNYGRVPGNKLTSFYLKGFTKEKPGRFSAIKTFHCYKDQKRHALYDAIPNNEKLNPSDPASFYCMVGAYDALEACTTLAREWKRNRLWDDGIDKLMRDTFELAPDVTVSDNKVDEHLRPRNPAAV